MTGVLNGNTKQTLYRYEANMNSSTNQVNWRINQLFIFSFTLIGTLFLLKYAADIVSPLLLSIAIAVILSPILTYLESKHIPKVVSLVVVILIALLPAIYLGGYIADEAKDFASNYQNIKAELIKSSAVFVDKLGQFGINISDDKINEILQKNNITEIIKKILTQMNAQFSNLFLILFMVAFMLMESKYFYNKMVKISNDYQLNGKLFLEMLEKIKSYFSIKVKTSLATGFFVLILLWYFNVSYYYMWAALAFFLNFIPVVGSMIAPIPAIIFAAMDYGYPTVIWVGIGYIIINVLIGSIIEPKLMGKGLGLSALIIFLSMTFWGWLFGPTGMILSAPLTMITQYLFDQYSETKWIALLLSDYEGGINDKQQRATKAS